MISISSMVGCPDLQTRTLGPYQGSLPTAFARLAALGYDGVELMLKDPAQLDSQSIRADLNRHGLRLAGICTGHVYGEDQLGLVTPDLKTDPAAFARMQQIIIFAAGLSPQGCLVNIGRSRGPADPHRPEDSLRAYETAFRALAEFAAGYQVRLILEPVTRAQVNFIHSTSDGLELVRRVNHPHFGLMLDTYHVNLEDEHLLDAFRAAAGVTWLVHFSDDNRNWPGNSGIDFPGVIRVLDETGFAGFVSTEIAPWPDPDTAARSSILYLRKYIPRR